MSSRLSLQVQVLAGARTPPRDQEGVAVGQEPASQMPGGGALGGGAPCKGPEVGLDPVSGRSRRPMRLTPGRRGQRWGSCEGG